MKILGRKSQSPVQSQTDQNLNDYCSNAGRGGHYKLSWAVFPPFSYILHTLAIA